MRCHKDPASRTEGAAASVRDVHRGWSPGIPPGGAPRREQNPGYARRGPGALCFGRGFNSRRLHHLLGLADLSVVVLARHFRTRRLLTFDERHFRALRPVAGRAFTLLPADQDAPARGTRPGRPLSAGAEPPFTPTAGQWGVGAADGGRRSRGAGGHVPGPFRRCLARREVNWTRA
jgi:hypothetical protein